MKRAVRLYRESDPKPVIAQLGRQLNVHPELRNWIRQDEADRGERDDCPTTAMVEENKRLARENVELRRVNEVLRAASAISIASSTYYGCFTARQQPSQRARTDAGLLVLIDEIRGKRVRRYLRLTTGPAGTAPPGRSGLAQAGGADHARQRSSWAEAADTIDLGEYAS